MHETRRDGPLHAGIDAVRISTCGDTVKLGQVSVSANHALHWGRGDQTNRSSAVWFITFNVWPSLPCSSNCSSKQAKISISHIAGDDLPSRGQERSPGWPATHKRLECSTQLRALSAAGLERLLA